MKHRHYRANRCSQWLAHLLILLLVSPPNLLASRLADPQTALIQALEQEATRLNNGLSAEGILDQSDYEAEAIIEFLRDKIVFQPYSGILRGVDGTLKSRAGNAHDQALTLASLLKNAGYEAQILGTTLSQAQAAELVESTAPIASSKANTVLQIPAFLDAVSERIQREGRRIETLNAESEAVADRLLKSLDSRWDAEPAAEIMKSARTASLSYRWVRWRTGPTMQWAQVHPALTAARKWDLKPSSTETNEIDSADLQKLAVSVTVETADGKQQNVSGEWQAPIANLNGQKLSIGISSNALLKSDLWIKPDQLVAQSRIFFVQINNQVLKDAKLFDLDGQFYSRSALEGLGSIFETMGQKTSSAAKALRGLGSSKVTKNNSKAVQRVVMHFILSAPDGTEQQVERVLYDRNATAPDQPAAGQLIQQWTISTASAPLVRSAHQLIQSEGALDALKTYQSMEEHFEKYPDADQNATKSLLAKSADDQAGSKLSYLRQMFDSYTQADRTSFFPYANILALRQGLRRQDDTWLHYDMTDIVANPRWSFQRNESGLVADPTTSVRHGVWETFVETLQLPLARSSLQRTSAYQSLAGADALIAGPNASSQHLTRSPTGTGRQNAWWQVDLKTGATVGMMQTAVGLGGAEISEAMLMQLILFGMAGVFAAVGTLVCTDGGGSFSCCAMANGAIAFIGYLLALPIGMIGSVAGAVGTIVGTASSVAIEVGMSQITVTCQPR